MGTLASELGPIAAALVNGPRVYADANVPASLVTWMRRSLGWDVLYVLEHDDLRRAPDRDHFHRARDLGRTLITFDHDFLDDRRFPPALSPGVIICAAAAESTLRRMLRDAHRVLLQPAADGSAPLRGRKITLVPEIGDGD